MVAAVPHDGERTATPLAAAGRIPLPKAAAADVEPADDVTVDWAAAAASPRPRSRADDDAAAVAAAGRRPWLPGDVDADGVDADAGDKLDSPPGRDDGRDWTSALAALHPADGELLLVGRWAALRCRLPIPCRACSRSSGGSCAGCSCPSGRSVSGT